MKLQLAIIQCDCGKMLVFEGSFSLDGNTCPGCDQAISKNFVEKTDGIAIFLSRSKGTPRWGTKVRDLKDTEKLIEGFLYSRYRDSGRRFR